MRTINAGIAIAGMWIGGGLTVSKFVEAPQNDVLLAFSIIVAGMLIMLTPMLAIILTSKE